MFDRIETKSIAKITYSTNVLVEFVDQLYHPHILKTTAIQNRKKNVPYQLCSLLSILALPFF